jgi:hypothetical protein
VVEITVYGIYRVHPETASGAEISDTILPTNSTRVSGSNPTMFEWIVDVAVPIMSKGSTSPTSLLVSFFLKNPICFF